MKINKTHLIYFSATGNTKKVVKTISKGVENPVVETYDITQGQEEDIIFSADELVIVGAPVYAGRIPGIAAGALQKFKGQKTPAIAVVSYGNREYDDALLELKNILESNGFNVISAGAFVGEHSIFPAVAAGRPDKLDDEQAVAFGQTTMMQYKNADLLPEIAVKGNFPYKEAKGVPLQPRGNRRCNKCGTCVRKCPVQAIPADHPRRTDKTLCISCGRCIKVCPQDARHFGGLLYKIAGRKFVEAYGARRKEPEMFYINPVIE